MNAIIRLHILDLFMSPSYWFPITFPVIELVAEAFHFIPEVNFIPYIGRRRLELAGMLKVFNTWQGPLLQFVV